MRMAHSKTVCAGAHIPYAPSPAWNISRLKFLVWFRCALRSLPTTCSSNDSWNVFLMKTWLLINKLQKETMLPLNVLILISEDQMYFLKWSYFQSFTYFYNQGLFQLITSSLVRLTIMSLGSVNIVLTKIIAKTCEQLEQNLPGKETQQPLAVWKARRWVRRKVLYMTLKTFSLLIALKPLLQKGTMAKLWKGDPSCKQPKLSSMHKYTKYFPIIFFSTLTHIYYIILFMLLSYSAFMNFVSQNDAICWSCFLMCLHPL